MIEEKNKSIINTELGLKDGQYVCPNCGGTEIKFSEKLGKLYCNFCDSTFEGKKLDEIEYNLFNLKGTIIGSGAQNIKSDFNDIITLQCGGCGAEVVIDTKTTTQARCHWCRSILSINSRIENGAVPDAILPFSIKKEQARQEIEKFVNKRKFYALPKFKKEFTTENIMGVYFPYMLVDAKAHCNFVGEGEHLLRKYTVNKSTRYDAKAYRVRREFDITIDNLTIESNKDRIDKTKKGKTNNIINSIMPFDTENCIKFQSNYLVGFTSEKRNININEIESKVNSQLKDVTRHSLNKQLTYYDRGIRWENETVNIIGSQWITAYLPVWLYSYYENKNGKKVLHYVAVNGRTKETMGSVPINKTLLFIVSAIIELFSAFIAIYLLMQADHSGDEDPSVFLFLLFLTGFVYYKVIYAKYRNQKARHKYESETENVITNIIKEDIYLKERRGLSSSRINGVNNQRIEGDRIEQNHDIINRTADKFIK